MKQFRGDPNFVQIHCNGKVGESSVIVMEYCNEGDLSTAVGKFKPKQVPRVWTNLSRALEAMRAKRIIHRDLKPENIFLHNGIVKIGDFGLAKQLNAGEQLNEFAGTPVYLAPEVLWNQPYDLQADLWSMGIVLYTVIHGRHPFFQSNRQCAVPELRQLVQAFGNKKHRYLSHPDPSITKALTGLLHMGPEKRHL